MLAMCNRALDEGDSVVKFLYGLDGHGGLDVGVGARGGGSMPVKRPEVEMEVVEVQILGAETRNGVCAVLEGKARITSNWFLRFKTTRRRLLASAEKECVTR